MNRIRYQTGELNEVVKEMNEGNIPEMDVEDNKEYEWVLVQLAERGVHKVVEFSADKEARDPVIEPEFEFRDAFSKEKDKKYTGKDGLMFLDFFFEPIMDRDYDAVGEL